MAVTTITLDNTETEHNNIRSALAEAIANPSIWAIYWTDSDTLEDVRLVRTQAGSPSWVFQPIEAPDPLIPVE